MADPRDSRGGDFNGSRGNSLPIGGAREVRYNRRIRRSLLVIVIFFENIAMNQTRALQVIIVMLGGGNWAEEAQVLQMFEFHDFSAQCLSPFYRWPAGCDADTPARFASQLRRFHQDPKKMSAFPTQIHHFSCC